MSWPVRIATLSKGVGGWILTLNFWRDLGRWDDTAVWKD